jgi:hypothetical protein
MFVGPQVCITVSHSTFFTSYFCILHNALFTFFILSHFLEMQMQSHISSVNFFLSLQVHRSEVCNPACSPKCTSHFFVSQIVPFSLFQHLVNFHKKWMWSHLPYDNLFLVSRSTGLKSHILQNAPFTYSIHKMTFSNT